MSLDTHIVDAPSASGPPLAVTICLQCAAVVGRDRSTGDEVDGATPGAELFCGHPNASIDPQTGAAREDLPACRDVNRGACPFFTSGAKPARPVRPPTVNPSESMPVNMRGFNAT